MYMYLTIFRQKFPSNHYNLFIFLSLLSLQISEKFIFFFLLQCNEHLFVINVCSLYAEGLHVYLHSCIYMILQINIRENVIFTINMYNAGRQAGRYVSHQEKHSSLICLQCWLESKFSHPLSDFTKCISRHVSKIQDYWSQLLFLGSHLILTKNNLDDTVHVLQVRAKGYAPLTSLRTWSCQTSLSPRQIHVKVL